MFNVAAIAHFYETVAIGDQSCDVTFLALPDGEVAEFDLSTAAGSKDFLRKVVIGFYDVKNDGEPISFEDARELLLDRSWCRLALAEAYFRALPKAARGN
ncbi:hypothetical protein SAMN02983003_3176 [Devosia enhydra]|uniref:Uncharacterized protein n=1 Tax=Devosia enhydra TaxID=665118 RepID=A0A1K2I2M2_9HYPH|nr:hypothetical protein [Devosia enhydra]SFZ86004.1 hypothetical protein SAMN02983003_3176 [Devosia enhydra]